MRKPRWSAGAIFARQDVAPAIAAVKFVQSAMPSAAIVIAWETTDKIAVNHEMLNHPVLDPSFIEAIPDREPVNTIIHRHREIFRWCNVDSGADLKHMRWSLDADADLHFFQAISRLWAPIIQCR